MRRHRSWWWSCVTSCLLYMCVAHYRWRHEILIVHSTIVDRSLLTARSLEDIIFSSDTITTLSRWSCIAVCALDTQDTQDHWLVMPSLSQIIDQSTVSPAIQNPIFGKFIFNQQTTYFPSLYLFLLSILGWWSNWEMTGIYLLNQKFF